MRTHFAAVPAQTWNPGIRQVPVPNHYLDLLYGSPLTYVSNPGARFVNSQLAMVSLPVSWDFLKMFLFSLHDFSLHDVAQISTEGLNTLTPGLRFCKTSEEFSDPKNIVHIRFLVQSSPVSACSASEK